LEAPRKEKQPVEEEYKNRAVVETAQAQPEEDDIIIISESSSIPKKSVSSAAVTRVNMKQQQKPQAPLQNAVLSRSVGAQRGNTKARGNQIRRPQEKRTQTFSQQNVEKAEKKVPAPEPLRRSNTFGAVPRKAQTIFAAGAIPRGGTRGNESRSRESFMGGARRATLVPSKQNEAVSSGGPPPALPRADQRVRAVDEVFKSEKVYLATLQRIIWMYKKPLALAKDSIISDVEVKDIFSNIEMMFEFNKNLMKDLERTKKESNSSTIGDIFLEHAPMMRLYSTYINNFDLSMKTLETCKTRSAFQKLLNEYNVLANGGTMDLSAYLIQPVQRLPRYEMLIGVGYITLY